MRAIVVREFGPPGVMRLEEIPDPRPGPGQALVRVHFAGVNPVDTYVRSGTHARRPALPYVPGTDAGGTVEAVGPGVERFKPGDRVYTHGAAAGEGTYAELVVCQESQLHPLPGRLTFEQGAAIGVPYATAWRALFMRANARAGETVLVHGASGGVGTAAVQLARSHGLVVAGTAGTAAGLEHVKAQGAHHAVNHSEPGYVDAIRRIVPAGPALILEMLANVNLDRDLDLIGLRGRVVIIGSRGRIEIDPRKAMTRDVTILGMTMLNATPEDLASIHAGLGAGLENGTLTPVIGRTFPLAEAAAAHQAVLEPGARGKMTLSASSVPALPR